MGQRNLKVSDIREIYFSLIIKYLYDFARNYNGSSELESDVRAIYLIPLMD